MVKKPTVTIGITAFNEEKALPLLLADIEKFDKTSLKLEKVIVYSDGSTDLTVNKAKKSAIKNLDVINMKKRQGKKAGINYILKKNKSDFLVLFDADIRIYDRNIISKLLNAFKKDKKIVLVGGNTQPLNPTSFFQRGVYSTFKVFEASRDFVKDGNNIFGCNGACMVLKADFAKRIQLPNIVNDDVYLYFSCLNLKC